MKIRSDEAAASQTDIKVYLYNSDDRRVIVATISTNEKGYAIGEWIDSYGEDDEYYFKFTKGATVYESEAPVTLDDLLGGEEVKVTCYAQE